MIVAIAAAAVKADAYASLLPDPTGLIVLLAVGLGFSVLRVKPVSIAVFAAGIFAFALDPPVVLGVALGVGAFALLIALFFAISTVLHARQRGAGRARRA